MSTLRGWFGRRKTIKARLMTVVLVPSVALLLMGAVASGFLLFGGLHARSLSSGSQESAGPAAHMLGSLQEERRLSMLLLARPATGHTQLDGQRKETDDALTMVGRVGTDVVQQSSTTVQARAQQFSDLLGQLPTTRQKVSSGQVQRADVFAYYNKLLDTGIGIFEEQARGASGLDVARAQELAAELFTVAEWMSRANALAASSLAAGGLTADQYQQYLHLVGAYHVQLDTISQEITPDAQTKLKAILDSDAWKRVTTVERALTDRGAASSAPLPVAEPDWQSAADQIAVKLFDLAGGQANYAASLGVQGGERVLLRTGIGAGVVLLVTVLAFLIATRFSRELVSRLVRLRKETLELADERLPKIVHRLRDGAEVDLDVELPPLDHGADEIGQVAHAFNRAQYTAVAAAVEEAQTREGVNTVFLGIAHRSQVIVHRQLKILDKAEREQEDPDQLELLFQLDHLATRSRRNAENLIILGGEKPGRQWRNPVRLVEISRSAVAETEHYTRVRTAQIPAVSLIGSVVADVIHLLAELVDNATTFSSPRSQVELSGATVAKGVVVEIEDHGLGMSEEDRERFNGMLTNPPDFGVMALTSDSRLGLFVVARLAARHGINVELRESAYGGTRAIVLIPGELIVADVSPTDSEATSQLPRLRRAQGDRLERPKPPTQGFSLGMPSELGDFWTDRAKSLTDDETPQRRQDPPRPLPQRVRGANAPDVPPGNGTPAERPPSVRSATPDQPAQAGEGAAAATRPALTQRTPLAQRLDRSAPPDRRDQDDQVALRGDLATSGRTTRDTRPPLPQRKRQANIAPQLLEDTSPSIGDPSSGETTWRSPEDIRSMMSAFQRGSRQGRDADENTDL
ncbi:HAMP domain-containing protein [Solihabitans fulvus]|uniref:histidine kinase n=1 Tax=Solihabitans fulvus TaxID=1892852 RepID=A0A5B2WWR4_9PSEU|nr:nitrate- and nitrite sensing domain-containing protein [Solihabitans fulvus]KAA2256091.1 HAMP domain-containing protein [Solihabitans fulvus]